MADDAVPRFDPNQPFEVEGAPAATGAPRFDPSTPHETEEPADDVRYAAPASAIARASFAPGIDTQIKRYAEHFNQPVTDFSIHGDRIVRKVPETGTYAFVE